MEKINLYKISKSSSRKTCGGVMCLWSRAAACYRRYGKCTSKLLVSKLSH